ncbi:MULTISPECIES: hypothetical protein [Bradyrhizobium]|uniref:hypothetical protein n=1 Tax=Bradyrhizobium TaxID=374 RepID=UPI001B89FB26|nr:MULTISPECIES: hypothetical protein [Bradyrhizobium]MBR0969088.1 hypothetical protein [Bradyrhizobium japonicum]
MSPAAGSAGSIVVQSQEPTVSANILMEGLRRAGLRALASGPGFLDVRPLAMGEL